MIDKSFEAPKRKWFVIKSNFVLIYNYITILNKK